METLSFAAVWLFFNPIIGGAVLIAVGVVVLYAINKIGALV